MRVRRAEGDRRRRAHHSHRADEQSPRGRERLREHRRTHVDERSWSDSRVTAAARRGRGRGCGCGRGRGRHRARIRADEPASASAQHRGEQRGAEDEGQARVGLGQGDQPRPAVRAVLRVPRDTPRSARRRRAADDRRQQLPVIGARLVDRRAALALQERLAWPAAHVRASARRTPCPRCRLFGRRPPPSAGPRPRRTTARSSNAPEVARSAASADPHARRVRAAASRPRPSRHSRGTR